jgi:hypothetical protein
MIWLGQAELTIAATLRALGFVQAEPSSAALGGRSLRRQCSRPAPASPDDCNGDVPVVALRA